MMNKDRIMELTEILNNPDLHGYLPNVCNELLQTNIELQKKAELGEHYKHLYSEIKKQKDDVVEYCKKAIESLNWKKRDIMQILTPENGYLKTDIEIEINKYKDLLRMLGEIDVED